MLTQMIIDKIMIILYNNYNWINKIDLISLLKNSILYIISIFLKILIF